MKKTRSYRSYIEDDSCNISSNMGTARAFLAVRMPLELAATLNKKAQHRAGDVLCHGLRWVPPQKQHITLKFLGNCRQNQLEALAENLRKGLSSQAVFDCMTGCFTCYPNIRHPRVLALEMHSGQELSRLAELCERTAVQSGFEPEHRRFRAHVTLGRFKGPKPVDHNHFYHMPSFRMTAGEVVLFKSEPVADGVRYQALDVFPLQPLAISA